MNTKLSANTLAGDDVARPDQLDTRLAHALMEQLVNEPLPAERGERLQQRLLARIAASQESEQSLAAGNSVPARPDRVAMDTRRWQPFVPGIQVKFLRRSGAFQSYLLQLAPGSVLPPHRHPLIEECVVLEGSLRIRSGHDDIVATKGTFHLAPAGEKHATISTESGALIYLRGAVPDPADIDWWHKGTWAALAPQGIKHWFRV